MIQSYFFTVQDLVKALSSAGLPVSRMWIYRQEDKGNLILPRSTTNFKKSAGRYKNGAVRVLTNNQINAIIKAFLPGGSGCFDYRKPSVSL